MTILLTKTTAAQNGVALSYRKLRRLYFLVVVVRRIGLTQGMKPYCRHNSGMINIVTFRS